MRERVADKLLFVVSVTPVFLCDCALAKPLIEHELTEAT